MSRSKVKYQSLIMKSIAFFSVKHTEESMKYYTALFYLQKDPLKVYKQGAK